MNYLDVFLLAVMAILTVRGVLRGFLSEITGLVGVVGGVILAGHFYRDFAAVLQGTLGDGDWVYAVSYVLILVGFMLLVGIIAMILGRVATFGCVQSVNHILGGGAGFVKGFAVAAATCYLVGLLIPQTDMVKESLVLPYVRHGMDIVGAELPRIGGWGSMPTVEDLRKLPEKLGKRSKKTQGEASL